MSRHCACAPLNPIEVKYFCFHFPHFFHCGHATRQALLEKFVVSSGSCHPHHSPHCLVALDQWKCSLSFHFFVTTLCKMTQAHKMFVTSFTSQCRRGRSSIQNCFTNSVPKACLTSFLLSIGFGFISPDCPFPFFHHWAQQWVKCPVILGNHQAIFKAW